MVVFDANFLLLLLDPEVDVPLDPTTKQPLVRAKERVEHLIACLSAQRETIGLPTPVISEVMVYAGPAAPAYLAAIGNSSRFRVLPFDLRAAVEVAANTHAAISGGDKKAGSTASWQKVKIDRQIVAIASVERATTIYADDDGVVKLAKVAGIQVVSSWDLPLPPDDPQGTLDL